MLIKVCGMRDPENIRQLIQVNPDMIGLIFYPKSARFVSSPERIAGLFNSGGRKFKLVGVFVNENPMRILELHQLFSFDYVQLHGQETAVQIKEIKQAGPGVIKAMGISGPDDFPSDHTYFPPPDYYLFDYLTKQHGGSGKKFDWKLLDHYRGSIPFLLSGGLDANSLSLPDHPALAGIDINSRFEIDPGVKNIEKIRKFIKNIGNE